MERGYDDEGGEGGEEGMCGEGGWDVRWWMKVGVSRRVGM